MKNINYKFTSTKELEEFIDEKKIKEFNNLLVQIFSGLMDEGLCKNISTIIKQKIPKASIIGTTTAGNIVDGEVIDFEISISFSIFDYTEIKSKLYINKGENTLAKQIVDDLVRHNTKAIIIFTDGLKTNGELLLKQIALLLPDLIVAGGKAGDSNKFEKTFVFNEDSVSDYGCVVASLSADELLVHNNYMLNCDSIGLEMTVTKSYKNRVYTINNKPANEIYKKYLGEDMSSKLPESGIEYPFLLERDGVVVSRSPIAAYKDGSVVYAGNLNEGEKIKFGFANIDIIQEKNFNDYSYFKTLPIETTFIYSCTGRRALLGKYMNIEFSFLQNLAPTVGFLTFGEYFHGNGINELLNITTTFLSISENKVVPKRKKIAVENINTDTSLKVLTHLVRTTSNELNLISKNLSDGQRIAKFGIWRWNLKNDHVWISDGMMLLFGIDSNSFNNPFKEFIHPDDRAILDEFIKQTSIEEKKYSINHRIITYDTKEIKHIHIEGEMLFDVEGKPMYIKGTAQDVTELIKSQSELEAYKNSLELRVKEEISKRIEQESILFQQSRRASMGEMIGNIAHQWRQPLNSLSLVIGNIKDAFLYERLDEAYLNKSYEKANRLIQSMSSTIDDFRDFFKPNKDKEEFNIASAVEDSIQLLDTLLHNNNIQIEKNLDRSLFAYGYKNEFSQVVLNIMTNAKDALIEHEVKHRMIRIELTLEDGINQLSIIDNAGGIPENIIEKIFDPYYTTKKQNLGTGIGLYMSKLIIEDNMSGKIKVVNIKNNEGKITGAMFTISI